MTAKDKRKIESVVYKIIEKYKPALLLQRNTFELKYGLKNSKSLMECVLNYPYLNVTIRYGDRLLEKHKDREDIAPYVIHEMCHVITDPLYSKAVQRFSTESEILDERELLTDYICNIVLKLP